MANITSDQINQTRALLQNAKAILILMPSNPTLDSIASALSLYLALSSSGRSVNVTCPSPMTVEFNRLIGVDKITNSLTVGESGRNLVISFPYQEGSIEKVSYNIDNDIFNLVIEPRENFPSITQEMIRYSNSGGSLDLIITINVPRLNDLDNLYNSAFKLFAEKPLINIDVSNQNMRYGKVNIIDPSSSSVSEIIVSLFSHLGFQFDRDTATNLYAGIAGGSANFTSANTSAYTLEAAAICLRNGAVKLFSQEITSPSPTSPSIPKQAQTVPFAKPQKPSFQKTDKRKVSPTLSQSPVIKESTHPETPPDWLKPKIYKGSTLL